MARLLPEARNGSRRVFADAEPARRKTTANNKLAIAHDLDELLRASQKCELTEIEFHNKTADLLGTSRYSQEVFDAYQAFESEILVEGCRAFSYRRGGEIGAGLREVARANAEDRPPRG